MQRAALVNSGLLQAVPPGGLAIRTRQFFQDEAGPRSNFQAPGVLRAPNLPDAGRSPADSVRAGWLRFQLTRKSAAYLWRQVRALGARQPEADLGNRRRPQEPGNQRARAARL